MNEEEKEGLLDDLFNACMSKEPVKMAAAFNDLMLGKTYDRIQAQREEVAKSMFNPAPEVEAPAAQEDVQDDSKIDSVQAQMQRDGELADAHQTYTDSVKQGNQPADAYNHVEAKFGKDVRNKLQDFHQNNPNQVPGATQ